MKKIILIFLCILFSYNAFAHKDTQLKLEKNGDLIGLPNQYAPAQFENSTYSLSIGNKSITIPECIKKHFVNFKNPDFLFYASWYHNSKTLPPYISIEIMDTNIINRYKILINLNTLEIIKAISITRIINKEGKVFDKMQKQEISVACENQIIKSILIV